VIPFDKITGFRESYAKIGRSGIIKFDSIILYTQSKNFELISYNIFSFRKLKDTLIEINIKQLKKITD